MPSVFDPEVFKHQRHSAGFDTKRTALPRMEAPGTVRDIIFGVPQDKPGQEREPRPYARVLWNVSIPETLQTLFGAELVVSQIISLDVDAQGELERGSNKNVQWGQLLDALGQNTGEFSASDLIGAGPAMLNIVEGRDPDRFPNEVRGVARIS